MSERAVRPTRIAIAEGVIIDFARKKIAVVVEEGRSSRGAGEEK